MSEGHNLELSTHGQCTPPHKGQADENMNDRTTSTTSPSYHYRQYKAKTLEKHS